MLLVALWVLLLPHGWGGRPFAAAAPTLTTLLLAWLLAAYGATALASVRSCSTLADELPDALPANLVHCTGGRRPHSSLRWSP